ncbi:MAG TPA: hypothetical protein VNB06_03955 [Thermoanaerobaculia bacterium]|nr:hypothetical protein [Thermoanaerobaculia bacterium]
MSRESTPLISVFFSAMLLAGCQISSDQSAARAYLQYEGELLVPGVVTAAIYPIELTYRVEGTETINGERYERTVSVTTGIPGTPPFRLFKRESGDTVYTLASRDQAEPVESLHPRAWMVGYSFTEAGGQTCTVESSEDVILARRTYEDVWKMKCQGGEETSTKWTTADNVEIKTVTRYKDNRVLELRLSESGRSG